jgi:hypothetical protein
LTFLPQTIEANLAAWIAFGLFDMPIAVCYAFGYLLACISPRVTIPALLSLTKHGYGSEKLIPEMIICAAIYECIFTVVMFTVCLDIVTA